MAPGIRRRATEGGAALAVVWRPVEALRPDPANPRSHSPKQIRRLAQSIGAFGFNVPILVDRGLRVLAGHGRLLAARELGWREVPTILLDHLSEARARAFMIADNRLAEGALWNTELLVRQLDEILLAEPDLAIEATGFELGEIDLQIGAAKPSAKRPNAGPPGFARSCDWWRLGRHRVGCGDLAASLDAMLESEDETIVVLAADPAAVDAIIRRWQRATGGVARREASGRDCADAG